jgi:hypothetical protein
MKRKLKMDAANVARRKKNKAEYAKYQASPKRKKYRAELNQDARERGIYGKRMSKGIDIMHGKDGKIKGPGSAKANRADGARKANAIKKKKKKKKS